MGTGQVAHRVESNRNASGIYYYWPKGDANSEADGCWIPHTNVLGYMIELHKNTHLENIDLRNRVNTAKANSDAALSTYTYWNAIYEQQSDYYDRKYLEYCGSSTGTCVLPDPQFTELDQLRRKYWI